VWVFLLFLFASGESLGYMQAVRFECFKELQATFILDDHVVIFSLFNNNNLIPLPLFYSIYRQTKQPTEGTFGDPLTSFMSLFYVL